MGSLCYVKLMSAPTLARACHSFGQATGPAGHERLLADADADAEPIPELKFDQTLGW